MLTYGRGLHGLSLPSPVRSHIACVTSEVSRDSVLPKTAQASHNPPAGPFLWLQL